MFSNKSTGMSKYLGNLCYHSSLWLECSPVSNISSFSEIEFAWKSRVKTNWSKICYGLLFISSCQSRFAKTNILPVTRNVPRINTQEANGRDKTGTEVIDDFLFW